MSVLKFERVFQGELSRKMKIANKLLTVLIIALTSVGYSSMAVSKQQNHILFLVDFSYSMHDPVSVDNPESKMSVVRKAFQKLLAKIPEQTSLALRGFAFSGSDNKSVACKASALWQPFGIHNGKEISRLIHQNKPLGHATPIAYALSQAKMDLATVTGARKIILLSDGLETCKQDPLPIAKALAAQGVRIDTIAVGEDTPTAQLGEIALEGGGSFHVADSQSSLLQALGVKAGKIGVSPSARKSKSVHTGMKMAAPANGVVNGVASGMNLVKEITLPEQKQQIKRPPASVSNEPVLYMELVMDASGSMAAKLQGRSKMDWAKQALNTTLKNIDEQNIALAFRAYGFDQSVAKTVKDSCPNTELLVPFSGPVISRVHAAVKALQPYGYTPIAESLRLAGRDLLPHRNRHPHILLISDGKETCHGDPVAAVKALRAQGIEVRVHVIGFDLDDEARKQLKAVAAAGGGQFIDARHASDLLRHIQLVLDEVQQVARAAAPGRFGNPVEGGDSIDQAQTLKPGTYTLKKDLPKGVRRYFYVATKIAEHASIRGNIQKYRPSFKKGAANLAAGFSAHIYTPDGKAVKGRSVLVRQFRGGDVTTGFMDVEGRGFYFAIGDNYVAVHRDAKFELLVESAGDLKASQEAGKNLRQALVIDTAKKYQASLGLEDRVDTYRLDGKAGKLVIAFAEPKFRFRVDFLDVMTGKRLGRFVKLAGRASLSLPASTSGLIIRIRDANPWLYHLFSNYTFSLGTAQ